MQPLPHALSASALWPLPFAQSLTLVPVSSLLQMTCEKVLDLMCYMVLPIQDGGKSQDEPSKVKPKFRKGRVKSYSLSQLF